VALTNTAAPLTITSISESGGGSVTVSNTGAVNITGAVTDATGAVSITSTGALTTSAAITGTNVALTGNSGVSLGQNITATGTLGLTTTNAAINQTAGTINATGATTVSSGTGGVSLTSATNDFGGLVTVTGSTVGLRDANALTATLNTTGDATLVAGTSLTVDGVVGNASSLTTTSGTTTSFGTLSVCCNLNATSGGAVSQTGAITIGGITTINAAGQTVTLTAANDFQRNVNLTSGTTQITDANALTLGTANTGALTIINTGALDLGTLNAASLSATSNNGAITQAGPAVVTGTTDLQAGAGAITLNAANSFTGAVTAGASSISMTNTVMLTPGTITAGGGVVNLTADDFNTTGLIQGGSATLSSGNQVGGSGTSLNINFGAGGVVLTGNAPAWNLSGPSSPQPTFTPSSQNTGANVFYNSGCISGPACAGVFSVTASIGASVAQIAAQALKDAQSTDSVAKQIDYGFAGDVGTTPPMDHRIDETGISTPDCFEESRENTACK
jgi:hypothetical protein